MLVEKLPKLLLYYGLELTHGLGVQESQRLWRRVSHVSCYRCSIVSRAYLLRNIVRRICKACLRAWVVVCAALHDQRAIPNGRAF